PLQFGAGEDFARYPRTLAVDEEKLRAAGCDALFAPDEAAMYPRGREGLSFVEVPELANDLCGAQRPGHFRGVATVVAKLFNIVQPDLAVFGEKDCQQLHIIRRMVRDLDVPVQIVGVPTVREADGLAMSSRNAYLNAEERRRAAELPRVLQALAARFKAGETDFRALEQAGEQLLREAGFEPDYLSLRRAADLAPPPPGERQLILLAAARLGKTRLIDNLPIDL
ncbi:MAG: pantoate--beta-alanine ligase, partial [Hydrogenophaga sp.]